MVGMVLASCNSGSSEVSYIGYLKIEEKQYTWQGDVENNEYTVAEKVGQVNKKVDKEIMPKTNFSSNFLAVGEEVYSSNEDSRVIIVKREYDGGYDKFIETDYYKDIKEIAWNFLVEKGWDDRAKQELENALVSEIIVNENYELLDNSYKGKQVLSITFEDKKDVVTSTPVILVDSTANKVVGYMPGE